MASPSIVSDIEEFLRLEETKELLRFTTAGSVDDGKSTLIGRLLYDSKGVYEDQIASVKQASVNRSAGPIDFSLLTDGLKAEREQGITIDVAYRYFATPKRKFIIADTPGHEQYTRNMATGASTAHLAIVLVDARKGVLPQSRRHAFIASLLGIPHVLVAVNKMDLVDYSQAVFDKICDQFRAFARELHLPNLAFLPISALAGDNVVQTSPRTPWYRGPSLLSFLEQVPVQEGDAREEPLRFPVQYVLRPSLDFRGYAGQLAAGCVKAGDVVMALPSGRTSRVKTIAAYGGDLAEAFTPMSVALTLSDEIDISRGDMLVTPSRMPHVSRRLEAMVVWMHAEPLRVGSQYLLKHTAHQTRATITALEHRVDVNDLARHQAEELHLNEIGSVVVQTHRPLFFDAYRENRRTGSFILIDPVSNATVAAGMILERSRAGHERRTGLPGEETDQSRLTAAERYARSGHQPAIVWLTARLEMAYLLERELFDRGCLVHVLADDIDSHLLPELAKLSSRAGLITICSVASAETEDLERARGLAGDHLLLAFNPESLPTRDQEAVSLICSELEERGLIQRDSRGLSGEGI